MSRAEAFCELQLNYSYAFLQYGSYILVQYISRRHTPQIAFMIYACNYCSPFENFMVTYSPRKFTGCSFKLLRELFNFLLHSIVKDVLNVMNCTKKIYINSVVNLKTTYFKVHHRFSYIVTF